MGSVSRAPACKALQTCEKVLENLCKDLKILCESNQFMTLCRDN
jgi:hypothetical protein